MNPFLGLLLLLLSVPTLSSSGWYFDQSLNGVEFWKNQDKKGCRIVVDQQDGSANKPVAYYRSELFKTELQERKKKTLEMFGVDQWTVQIGQIAQRQDDVVVDFSGHYKDRLNEKTYYYERHIYGPKRYLQFLYTCSLATLLTNPEEAFSLIQFSLRGGRK